MFHFKIFKDKSDINKTVNKSVVNLKGSTYDAYKNNIQKINIDIKNKKEIKPYNQVTYQSTSNDKNIIGNKKESHSLEKKYQKDIIKTHYRVNDNIMEKKPNK